MCVLSLVCSSLIRRQRFVSGAACVGRRISHRDSLHPKWQAGLQVLVAGSVLDVTHAPFEVHVRGVYLCEDNRQSLGLVAGEAAGQCLQRLFSPRLCRYGW